MKMLITKPTSNYSLHGKNIVHLVQGNDKLHFFYDASNKPAIVEFNGTKYAYVQDLQGDICQIVDSNGTVVVEYTYDAWGKVLNVTGSMAGTLGKIQPFRYRGYVYDVETGLYYLRSRYYKPEWHRFTNSDIIYSNNTYAYCHNQPVIKDDENGFFDDYTDYISHIIQESLTTFSNHSINPKYEMPSAMDLLMNAEQYLWFAEQMDHHAPWDIKEKDSWEKQFPDIPSPESHDRFLFRGKIITSEDLGNYCYGYFGTCMGFNEEVLYAFGGVAKRHNYTTFSTLDDLMIILDDLITCIELPPYYGDDENDHEMIKWGIQLYHHDNK